MRRIAMYVMARRVAMYVVQAVVVVVVFSGDSYKSIAFCSIRGGGRGSGGVILYEKKIATVAGSYRGISATFCKEHCNVSETYRPRSPSRILQKTNIFAKNAFIAGHLNGAFVDMNKLRPLLFRLLYSRR